MPERETDLAAASLVLIDDAQSRVHARAPRWSGTPLAQLPMILAFTALLSSEYGANVPAGAAVSIGLLWVAGFVVGLMLNARSSTPLVRFCERWPRTGRSSVVAGVVYAIAAIVSFTVAVELSWWWFGFPAVALVVAAYAVDDRRWHAAFTHPSAATWAVSVRAARTQALVGKPFDDADAVSVMAALTVLQKIRSSALGPLIGLQHDDAQAAVKRLQAAGVAWMSDGANQRGGWVEALLAGRRAFKIFVRRVESAASPANNAPLSGRRAADAAKWSTTSRLVVGGSVRGPRGAADRSSPRRTGRGPRPGNSNPGLP